MYDAKQHSYQKPYKNKPTVRNVILDLKIFSSNFTILLIVVA